MTHLEVAAEDMGEIRVLRLKGFLDAHNHHLFRAEMEKSIALGRNKIVVDFQDLSYIGSSGIEVILAHVQRLRDLGGDIRLAAMTPRVFKVFDLLGLPTFFRILDTREKAVSSFEAAPQPPATG